MDIRNYSKYKYREISKIFYLKNKQMNEVVTDGHKSYPFVAS